MRAFRLALAPCALALALMVPVAGGQDSKDTGVWDIASPATIIGAIGVIISIVMPIWLRSLDYFIHRWRRWRQVVNIRTQLEIGCGRILKSERENLPIRSATPGTVGQILDETKERKDAARYAYFRRMIRELEDALQDFSNDLTYEQKRDIRRYLDFQKDFLCDWKNKRSAAPSLEVYEDVLLKSLSKIEWIRLNPEKLR